MAVTNEVQLKVDHIYMAFGGVQALMDISLEVKKGEIFSVIGPNGAGKTVLLNCINGLYHPQKGEIYFEGKEISKLKPHQRAEIGISRTFQKIELFKGTSVLDNIRLGRHIHLKTGLLSGSIYIGKTAREEIEHRDFIEREIIDLLEIEHIRDKVVGMLPYGLQKRVELARALARKPELILLDEVAAGSTEMEIPKILTTLKEIRKMGITVIIVEHVMKVMVHAVDRIVVIDKGIKIAEGAPISVMNDSKVIEAYFGA